jgi:SAM-dependent methyltransferase
MDTSCASAASVRYWDGNAKWYKLWAEHNAYHHRIIEVLRSFVLPAWKVLDIGAGNGILSLPLSALGCRVTCLEPSAGMRALLEENAAEKNGASILIDSRRWEDMPLNELYEYDLIIASNSLHLTGIGFSAALEKIFLAKPLHACIISEEQFLDCSPESACHGYSRCFKERYSTESSYAYHCLEDAFEHWSFKHGRQPDPSERLAIMSGLSHENGHLWRKGKAALSMYWWARHAAIAYSNRTTKGVHHVYQDSSLSYSHYDFSSFC